MIPARPFRYPGQWSVTGHARAKLMDRVVFLPGALTDYQGSFDWYRARSEKAAVGFEAAVAAGLQRVVENPEGYALVDERHRRCLLRRYPFGIIFRILRDEIL